MNITFLHIYIIKYLVGFLRREKNNRKNELPYELERKKVIKKKIMNLFQF